MRTESPAWNATQSFGHSARSLASAANLLPSLRRPHIGMAKGMDRWRVRRMLEPMAAPLIVAGIDVGGSKKGFHAVALRDGAYHDQCASRSTSDIAAWCRRIGATVIAVDAPCRWSIIDGARPAERKLMAVGIGCFATPTREKAVAHATNHFGWMLNGAELFRELETSHPLFVGARTDPGPACLETFPQAVACALAGEVVSAKRKGTVRRKLLASAGVDLKALTSIDRVDAALCAVAAHFFATGSVHIHGEAETGFIVVPRTSPSMNGTCLAAIAI